MRRSHAAAALVADAADAVRRGLDIATAAGDERRARDLRERLSAYEGAAARESAEPARRRSR